MALNTRRHSPRHTVLRDLGLDTLALPDTLRVLMGTTHLADGSFVQRKTGTRKIVVPKLAVTAD